MGVVRALTRLFKASRVLAMLASQLIVDQRAVHAKPGKSHEVTASRAWRGWSRVGDARGVRPAHPRRGARMSGAPKVRVSVRDQSKSRDACGGWVRAPARV